MACNFVTAAQLVELLKETSEILLIDCRSFLVFNKSHISGATNVRCNSIMRRRSKGLFSLENAITNSEKRKDFLSGNISTVILYDDQKEALTIEEISPLKSRRTMSMVLEVLQLNSVSSTRIVYLNGSYKEFSTLYPESCEGNTRTSLSSIECEPPTTSATPSTMLTPIYDQGPPVEILPHLYLGSAHHATQKSQLQFLGITAILNASSTCSNHFEETFKYKRVPVEDNSQADISVWFKSAINFINDVKENGGKVFVHCHAGVSRSATICLAYLIMCHGISLSDAFRYVKRRRNVISPNFNFMGQLLKLETDMASKKKDCKSKLTFDFSTSVPVASEEMDWQNENNLLETNNNLTISCTNSKLYHRRALASTAPLTSINNNQSSDYLPKLCLTASPRQKDFSFFSENGKSCSQQSSQVHRQRHSRTVTLST